MVIQLTFLFLFVLLLVVVGIYAIHRIDLRKRQKPKKLKNKPQKKAKKIKDKNQKLEVWITRKDKLNYYYIYELNGVEFIEFKISKKNYKNQTLEEIQNDLLKKFKNDIKKVIQNVNLTSDLDDNVNEWEELEYSEEFINWIMKNIL